MKKIISAKKIVSLLVIAALALTTSVCYFAADNDDEWKNNTGTINLDNLTVTGKGIEVDGNTVLISEGGDFTVTGSLADGMIKVNSEDKVKLRLSGMSLSNSSGPAIYFENVKKGFITITEDTENFLTDSSEYSIEDADATLFSNDDLEIKGAGTLTIDGNYKHGIASDDDLSIENGTITITSYEHGIKANDKLSISGGNIDITAETGKGIKAGEELVIDAGVINMVSEKSEGIESKGTLTINGGDINVIAADDGINTGSASTGEQEGFGGRGQAPSDRDFGDNENGENMRRMPNDGNLSENGERQMPENGDFNKGRMKQMPQDGENMPQMPQNGNFADGNMPPMPQNGEFADGNMQQMPGNGGMPDGRQNGRQMRGQKGDMQQMPEADGNMPSVQGRPDTADGNMMQERQGGAQGGGFGRMDEETAAAHAITINGGNIYIKAVGDGIDSNGTLTITGGTIVIDGPEGSGNGPLDSESTMTITGGEISTLSSAGMLQIPNDSDSQNILKAIFTQQGTAGDKVTVKDSNGKELMTHTAAGKYMALIYSSSELKEGNEYSIYVNDELYETVTLSKGTTSVGTAQGGMGGFGGGRMNGRDRNNSQQNISVSVDGKNVSFNTNPVIKNDTTLVGFRAILEMLGAEVSWDGDTQTVTAEKDGINIKLVINSDKAYVNGEEKTLLTAPEIINDSTMIPVRFVSEQLSMNVDWDEQTRHINITSLN